MGKCGSKNRRVGETCEGRYLFLTLFYWQIGWVRTTTSRMLDRQGSGWEEDWVSCNCTGVSNQLVLLGGVGYPQYGLESSCPEGVDQNTALLATAAVSSNCPLVWSQLRVAGHRRGGRGHLQGGHPSAGGQEEEGRSGQAGGCHGQDPGPRHVG